MEEAYGELYQQFLRLRSLCLRQAALLHQLTTALQKQQGMNFDSNANQQHPTPPHGAEHTSRNVGCAAGVLAEGMSKLSVNMPCQRKQDVKTEMLNPFMFNTEFSKYHADPPSSSKPSEQNGPGERRAPCTAMVSVFWSEMCLLNLSGGAMMSDVAMHSHVCDFCQAVFPGDSTTRGEFLRHLHTHVT
uniref:TRAF family member-associated NFKB activator n=1 Tax=Xiphophorus couchianus TaxID=32473 RepID=A0A3B5MXJ3_9TELE